MSNEGGRKANPKCFIELVLTAVKWGSVLLGPLRTVLSRNGREDHFLGLGTNCQGLTPGC